MKFCILFICHAIPEQMCSLSEQLSHSAATFGYFLDGFFGRFGSGLVQLLVARVSLSSICSAEALYLNTTCTPPSSLDPNLNYNCLTSWLYGNWLSYAGTTRFAIEAAAVVHPHRWATTVYVHRSHILDTTVGSIPSLPNSNGLELNGSKRCMTSQQWFSNLLGWV